LDFESSRSYVEVCLDYALSYTESELSRAFSKALKNICYREMNDEDSNKKPIYIEYSPFESEHLPTNIEDGLWRFFGNKKTLTWGDISFAEYYINLKDEMKKCYVPFRKFSEDSFQDSMRLRVYQDSMNIITGRKLNGKSKRHYSIIQRGLWRINRKQSPEL
jgi:hypothetical protein